MPPGSGKASFTRQTFLASSAGTSENIGCSMSVVI